MTVTSPTHVRHRPLVTPTRLFSAPLSELLEELDVESFRTSISDAGFFGALIERKDGRLILALPQARDARTEDTVARALLGQVLQVPMSP
ncbi:hypothetical protein, partial [Streptomyces candidus]